ncbi:glycoside hydrolase family 88 protein [Pedobacter sp. SD-b]|uniref:Glycoside hydrolase family 88 protein n=1 Tax=Pedobacter segetis TaxID=2793069 RepID=A0ABS1BM14_9SPHI|nr:glycoside hydrolase family 88 protein [Pedobacter segetis]MBK0383923.1 glycoside hydrolase family 88 protein [Pedobacter segetis]
MRNKILICCSLFVIVLFSQACNSTKKASEKKAASNTERAMLKALEWQEAHPIVEKSPKDWTNGAYYTGVAKAYEATKNPEFLNALKGMAGKNNWEPYIRINSADDIAISYAYIYLKSIHDKDANLKPTEEFIKKHLAYKNIKDPKKPLWWWCDALFMAPPVLTKLAKVNNDPTLLDAMYKNYKETYDLLYDKEEHLFARDDRFIWTGAIADKKEKNGKKIFWSRGNGWVLGGLALILEDMPKNYIHRPFFENLFKEMSVKVKELQQPDGLWTTSLLSPESYDHTETSGSGFFTFGIAWGINNGLLNPSDFKSVLNKAWPALLKNQKQDGMVGFVQDIGFDPRPATAESWQNYGTGAFLLAGSEVLKMK